MHRTSRGFTLVELMLVVAILGILAAIVFSSYGSMQERACEASTRANMHTFQLAAEDFCARNHGACAGTAADVAALLPNAGSAFHNPFDRSVGDLYAWKDVAAYSDSVGTGSTVRGIVAYADSATIRYVIAGRGAGGELPLHLLGGS